MSAEGTQIAGYMVLIEEGGRIVADWDGEVHPTQAEANGECIKARQAGYDAFTAQLCTRRILKDRLDV